MFHACVQDEIDAHKVFTKCIDILILSQSYEEGYLTEKLALVCL